MNDRANDDPTVVWWRQFEVPAPSQLDLESIDDVMVRRAQWRTWLATLDHPSITWVNPLWSARRAENKIEQLRVAQEAGFAIPETIVTNRRQDALAFSRTTPAVVKSLSSAYFEFSGHAFVYTQLLEDKLLAFSEQDWAQQPVIVQQQVTGSDIRVIAFNDRFFGAKCEAPGIDWRRASDRVQWVDWAVPDALARSCATYLLRLDLRYAAFDFIDDGETIWFLEANQAGEWVFLERTLHLGITEAFSHFLVERAS